MKSFLQKHAAAVIGVLSGFDRLVFRGSLREICYGGGMGRYLSQARVLLKEFAGHAEAVTKRIRAASFEIFRNRETKRLELQPRLRKCLHYYHYWMHPKFGLMHARLQTWFPFTIQICLNGREWLARTLDRAGVGYRKLEQIAHHVNPAHAEIFRTWPISYYWSTHQSEWATDVVFRDAGALAALSTATR